MFITNEVSGDLSMNIFTLLYVKIVEASCGMRGME